MAFVREHVPEKDWNLYNSWGLKDTSNKPLLASKYKGWTADRERNIYFFGLGGHGADAPWSYALMWNNDYILIYASDAIHTNNDSSKELQYNISQIFAP